MEKMIKKIWKHSAQANMVFCPADNDAPSIMDTKYSNVLQNGVGLFFT